MSAQFFHDHPPPQFVLKNEVVGCYCGYEKKILLLLRNQRVPQPLQWALPGGKVERGESLTHAIRREMQEETGILLAESDLSYLGKVYTCHRQGDFIYHMFHAPILIKPSIILEERTHLDFEWVELSELVNKKDLIAGLIECTQKYYLPFSERI